MAKAIIIWDSNKRFVEELSVELGVSSAKDAIYSLEELKNNIYVSSKDAVIVLLDTDIDSKKRSAHYGLKIVKELRKELRYKGLIVVYSTMTEKQIRQNVKGSEILFTSSIRLRTFKKQEDVNVKDFVELINSVPRLSDDLLDDIIYNVFDNKGKIHELLHNLKNKLNDIDKTNTLIEYIKEAKKIFDDYEIIFKKEVDPFKNLELEKIYTTLKKETIEDISRLWDKEKDKLCFCYSNAGDQVNKFSAQILELAPVSNEEAETQKVEQINWQVLFYDDTDGVREKVQMYFAEKKVTCHIAKTENEVYEILKNNTPDISLFISDIRLLDEDGHWCDRQGYDVIEEVKKKSDYPLVYAVLTSKKGTINKMVQKKRKYEILWFTKDDVISSAQSFNVFFDLIKECVDETYNSNKIFQPNYKSWYGVYKGKYAFPLREYYKLHKESQDYHVEERSINKKTLDWLLADGEKPKWTCRLEKKNIDNAELKRFRDAKLLGRRVALALAAEDPDRTGATIYEIMTGNDIINAKNKSVNQLYTCLAMSSLLQETINDAIRYFKGETFSLDILYEEYEFLKKEYFEERFIDGMNLGNDREVLEEFVSRLEKAISVKRISEPVSFQSVKSILRRYGFPRQDRLENMLLDLQELSEDIRGKDLGDLYFLSSLENELLKDLFERYGYKKRY
jgi:hypothetical protein